MKDRELRKEEGDPTEKRKKTHSDNNSKGKRRREQKETKKAKEGEQVLKQVQCNAARSVQYAVSVRYT